MNSPPSPGPVSVQEPPGFLLTFKFFIVFLYKLIFEINTPLSNRVFHEYSLGEILVSIPAEASTGLQRRSGMVAFPAMIFLMCAFLVFVILMIYKWVTLSSLLRNYVWITLKIVGAHPADCFRGLDEKARFELAKKLYKQLGSWSLFGVKNLEVLMSEDAWIWGELYCHFERDAYDKRPLQCRMFSK